MKRAATPRRAQFAHGLFLSALLGALAFACNSAPLAPRPGLVELTELARVPVPGGHVSAAGGNFFHERVDLALDTRLGPLQLGAVYNSAWGWTASIDASYARGTLRDASGASLPLASLADGAPVPGTHWVKLDATRVKTRGGLVHVFDATTGRLLAIHWSSASYPRLRFVQVQLGAQWRTRAVEQCTNASACTPLFTLGYDASARLVRADDRAGRSALYAYDGAGRLAAARSGLDVASGRPGERYGYANGFLAAITSSEGERIEIASDALGRALEVRAIGAGDPTWRFAYGVADAAGVAITTVADPLGNATAYAIDAALRVQSVTNPLGERTAYTWSGPRPSSRTLPDGTRTEWTWADDDLASELAPSGNLTRFSHQADGVDRERPEQRALLEERDVLGLVERRAYDASGRLASITNGAGETTAYAFGADESLASVTAPDGARFELSGTGEHGHPAFAVFRGSSDYAVTSYDAVGNAVRSTAPDPRSGGVKQRRWDAGRNLAALELLDGSAGGAPTLRMLTLETRSDGQLARVDRPYGGATTFSYDALGRLVAIAEQSSPGATAQPGAASVTTLARDALGRITAIERANGMREEASYDAAGRVVRRRALLRGVVESDVSFAYAGGRLVRASAPGGFDEALTYDSAGRLFEIVHSLGETTRFRYDARSRIVQTELVLPGGAPLASLGHTYDLADRELSLAYLGASLISRQIVAGRLERTLTGNGLREDALRSTQTGHASGSELWRGSKRVAQSSIERAFAPGGEITRLRTEVSDGGAADGVTQEDYGYATLFGQAAMERRVESSLASPSGAPAEQLRYDALSSYVGGTSPFMAQSVAFNAEHDRVLSAELPAGGPVPSVTSRFASDSAGFTTTQTFEIAAFTLGLDSFAWNARGQLATIHSDGALVASFEYDALGRRSARTLLGMTRRWRFGGLVEADAGGQPVALDLGAVRIDLAGSQHRYRHADARGNPKLATNAAGRVVRHAAYFAYGESGVLGTGADDASFADGVPIVTAHARYLLIGARLYSPALGRFLAPDPSWSPLNAFAYTLGNPVDFWDPAGLESAAHLDEVSAQLGLARAMLGVVAAVVTFGLLGGPLAAIGLGFAALAVADALVELDQQRVLREQASLSERGGGGEAIGGGASPSLRGGGSHEWRGGGLDRGPRTGVVCSNDGTGVICTPSGHNGFPIRHILVR